LLNGSELYSAREKNGIYIPHDRYFEEEAEKKGMVEKIERMEFDLETKDKVYFHNQSILTIMMPLWSTFR
jgi:hypothetical protein